MLAASKGTTIEVQIHGDEAAELAEALERLVADRFENRSRISRHGHLAGPAGAGGAGPRRSANKGANAFGPQHATFTATRYDAANAWQARGWDKPAVRTAL